MSGAASTLNHVSWYATAIDGVDGYTRGRGYVGSPLWGNEYLDFGCRTYIRTVPELVTLALFGLGVAGLGILRRKRAAALKATLRSTFGPRPYPGVFLRAPPEL
jgi:hypothetical protein